jgi:hypothetical protein
MNVVGPGITIEDYESGKAKPIDVFEGQIKEWILGFARHLAHEHGQREHAGIAVLLLTSSVLEPLGGVLPLGKRRKNSESKFCNGFVRVFPEVPGSKDAWQVGERVCDLLRHGLFHEAFIKAGVVLTSQDDAIFEKDGIIYLDPIRFFDAVDSAFAQVCSDIRSADANAPIRLSFDAYWSQREADQARKLEVFVTPETEYPPVYGTSGTARPVSGTSTLAPAGPRSFGRKM